MMTAIPIGRILAFVVRISDDESIGLHSFQSIKKGGITLIELEISTPSKAELQLLDLAVKTQVLEDPVEILIVLKSTCIHTCPWMTGWGSVLELHADVRDEASVLWTNIVEKLADVSVIYLLPVMVKVSPDFIEALLEDKAIFAIKNVSGLVVDNFVGAQESGGVREAEARSEVDLILFLED